MTDPLSIDIALSAPLRTADPSLPTRKLLTPSPNEPDSYILEIDNSSLEKFTTCPRSAENYLLHSREAARDSSATAFGGLFHRCEELRLLYGMSDAVAAKQRELVFEHFLHHPVAPYDHRTPERMLSVLTAYNERYKNDRLHESLYRDVEGSPMVEKAFKVELCTLELNANIPYEKYVLTDSIMEGEEQYWIGLPTYVRSLHILYTGRIDAVLHDSGALWVMDHKTSSIGGEQYYEDFRLSAQTVGYCWAAQRLLGMPLSGLLLNAVVIRKPSKTGNGLELDRRTYWYSQDRLVEWEENTKSVVADFVSNLVRGFFPQHTKWCMGKYGICPYHGNCDLPREQRVSDLASDLYRDATWNPTTQNGFEGTPGWLSPK